MEKPIINAAEARKVLEKNVANIIKKSAAGHTLTKGEQRVIANFAEGNSAIAEEWVSFEELGKIVGLHPKSFRNICKANKDAPKARANGGQSVAEWKAFLAKHQEINCKSAADASAAPSRSEWELEKLRQQCRRLTYENDIRENKYVLKAEVEAWTVDLAEKIKSILRSNLKNELPPKLEGLRAAEIAAKMEEPISKISRLIQFCQAAPDGAGALP